MKIALLGTRGIPPTYGGSETYVENLALRLAQSGDDVVVYCEKVPKNDLRPPVEKKYPANIRRVIVPSIRSKHLDNFTRSFFSAVHASFDRSIDVVQVHNFGPSWFAFLPRLFGKKVVGAIRAMDSQREKWGGFARFYLRLGEKLIVYFPHATTTNSKAIQDYYAKHHKAPVTYIPNGADIPQSLAKPNRIKQWQLGERDYLLFVARLVPEKGCHTLVTAFENILDKIPSNMKLAIAGGTSFSSDYIDGLLEHRSERVVFLDYVWGDTLEELYSNAYAFVLPSAIEGMSNSLLAAMAHARPVVVSDIAENSAVIEDAPYDEMLQDKPGLVFKLDSAQDLAGKLQTLIDDPSASRRRGELLQEHIRRFFSWDVVRDQTREVYEDILRK